MKHRLSGKMVLFLLLLLMMPIFLCRCADQKSVTIYTSVDQVYSEEIFKLFEKETGIRVQAVYDIEAAKTVGLVQRLISEKHQPVADVFWNGEALQTMRLVEEGVVQKDQWKAFGGRARVLIYNKKKVAKEDLPRRMADLTDSKYGSGGYSYGMAYPMFGTTSTHAAVLYAVWGPAAAREFFERVKTGGVTVLEGNSVVKDFTDKGKICFGLTDTDDAYEAMQGNPELDVLFLDQGAQEMGTLVIPNTVARIQGGPNSKGAEAFVEFLLADKAREALLSSGWLEGNLDSIRPMEVDWTQAYQQLESSKEDMTKIFAK